MCLCMCLLAGADTQATCERSGGQRQGPLGGTVQDIRGLSGWSRDEQYSNNFFFFFFFCLCSYACFSGLSFLLTIQIEDSKIDEW